MSGEQLSEWIWMNGEWTKWADATVHVSAHALHYGSSVFEGIRAYLPETATAEGPAVFRLDDHVRRLFDSAKLARLNTSAYSPTALREVCLELIDRNRHGACYLRPVIFRDAGGMGVDGRKCPTSAAIFSFEWGSYLGDGAITEGVDARVSSWRRIAPGAMVPMGKIGGQYVNNQLASMEAHDGGFAEAILLDHQGFVSEGGGENLFLVRDGALLTPPMASSILAGITRDTVVTLARDLDIEVRETTICREMLYLADEVFMTGTAAEITPVRSIDQIAIGEGRRGPVTESLQRSFYDLVNGRTPDRHDWLTPTPTQIPSPKNATARAVA